MTYTGYDIATFIAHTYGGRELFRDLTHMKLQKIVYYVKVWSLVNGHPVVSDIFERWKYGPVSRALYGRLHTYAAVALPVSECNPTDVDGAASRIIDVVMYTYGRLSAFELSQLTHEEYPWNVGSLNSPIDDGTILAYYSKVPFARNFPFVDDAPFLALHTQSVAAFTFDISLHDRESTLMFRSFADYRATVDSAISAEMATTLDRLLAPTSASS